MRERWQQGATMFDPNDTPNKVLNSMNHAESTKDNLIKPHDGCDKDIQYVNVFKHLK